jgi:hypothetical protein
VRETIKIADSGSIKMTIKKPDGTTSSTSTSRASISGGKGDYIRGKWGIYRGKSDQLKQGEEIVRFANFGITKGATPSSRTCRAEVGATDGSAFTSRLGGGAHGRRGAGWGWGTRFLTGGMVCR